MGRCTSIWCFCLVCFCMLDLFSLTQVQKLLHADVCLVVSLFLSFFPTWLSFAGVQMRKYGASGNSRRWSDRTTWYVKAPSFQHLPLSTFANYHLALASSSSEKVYLHQREGINQHIWLERFADSRPFAVPCSMCWASCIRSHVHILKSYDLCCQTRWWFQIFFIFTPIWGRFPFWPIFFRWVETTNQQNVYACIH